MGQLNGGVFPHRHPGRDAGEDGTLGGPHQTLSSRLVVVLLQIHHAHQAPAHLSALQNALHIEQGVGVADKAALPEVAAHGVVDLHDVGLHIGTLQAALRQNEPQSRGGAAHILCYPLPVFRLRGILVAGHHAPLGVFTVLGQQNVRGTEGQGFKRVHDFHLCFQNWVKGPCGCPPAALQTPQRQAARGGQP